MTERERIAEHNLAGYNDDPAAFQLPKAPPVSAPTSFEGSGPEAEELGRRDSAEGAKVLLITSLMGLAFVLLVVLLLALNALL